MITAEINIDTINRKIAELTQSVIQKEPEFKQKLKTKKAALYYLANLESGRWVPQMVTSGIFDCTEVSLRQNVIHIAKLLNIDHRTKGNELRKRKFTTEIKPCPRCNGTGKITVKIFETSNLLYYQGYKDYGNYWKMALKLEEQFMQGKVSLGQVINLWGKQFRLMPDGWKVQ